MYYATRFISGNIYLEKDVGEGKTRIERVLFINNKQGLTAVGSIYMRIDNHIIFQAESADEVIAWVAMEKL